MAYQEPTAQLGTPEYTAQLNANASSLGTNTTTTPTSINSQSLSGATPLDIPAITQTGNPAAAIISTSQANVDAQTQAEQAVAKETASLKPLQEQRTGILDAIKGYFGDVSTAQNQAITDEAKLDPYRKDLADINKTIADTTVAYRGEKDAINGNGSITKEGQQSLLSNVETKYGRQLADLTIRQSAANQNITALQSAADRKLALTLAPIQTQINYLKDFALANNDTLTQQEKDKINLMISEKDKIIKQHTDEQNIANTALKTALENGVKIPDGVTQQVLANPAQAYSILATNGISLESQKSRLETLKLQKEIDGLGNPNGPALPQDYSNFLSSRTPEQTATFQSLPTGDQSVVAQLVNGDALLTDLVKSRGAAGTKDIQRYIQEATAIDPTFSVNTNKVRYQFLQDWNNPNGKSSITRNAINTALGHLADFKTNADALNSGQIRKLNSVKNVLTTETGDAKVLQLRTDINALASEIATIYKEGQPTQGEIDNWESTIAADFSKGQFTGVSNEISKLLSSKITATRYQYKSTMGSELNQSLIDPDKRQALLNAGINPDVLTKENIPGQSGNAPANTTLMTGPDGQDYHVPNNQVDAFLKAGGKKK